MKAKILAALIAVLPPAALAQDLGVTVTESPGGAGTGAVLAGPMDTAIGNLGVEVPNLPGSGVEGPVDAPPPPATFVLPAPVTPGYVVPPEITLYEVPNSGYYYTVVNNQRLIVDPQSRTVLQVLN